MSLETVYFWPLAQAARRVLDADEHYRTVAYRMGEDARLRALMELTAAKRELRAMLGRIEGNSRTVSGAAQNKQHDNNGVKG